ncbi:MAG TPA: condensation domain-containing protein [Pilimelia sp.]|nr:condensation domain-containing protein [Pilimelia sp.]
MVYREVPASVAQRLLWMIRHYRSDFGALSCPVLCRLHGPLDPAALGAAVDGLTRRHESLRTTFAGRGARLRQLIHEPRPLPMATVDLGAQADPEAAVRDRIAAELRDPIDPGEWPARATLWRLGPASYVFCLNLHHLVTDAWSTGILLRDLAALYAGATTGSDPAAGPGGPGGSDGVAPGWQYADFAAWQQRLLDGEELGRHQAYWRRQLAGSQLPRLRLDGAAPGARPANGAAAAGGVAADGAAADGAAASGAAASGASAGDGAVRLDLDRAVVAGLRELARVQHTTVFAVLLAGFHAHLSRLTGQGDLAVASMFANRSRPELRDTVGLLANMVLLRSRISPNASYADLVSQAHAAVIGAFTYQDLPYQMLPLDVVTPGGGRADDVMFQVMTPVSHRIGGGGVDFELLLPDQIGSRFRFELTLTPVGEHDLRAVLFHTDGTPQAAAGFLQRYADLVAAGVRAPHAPLPR